MCYTGQVAQLFKNGVPAVVARQHSVAIAVMCVVRLFLLGFFESSALHACHISVTILYILNMLMEMLYYETINATLPNVVRVAVQVVTAAGFAMAQRWLCAIPQAEPVRRKGRLFAKHYMEGHLLDPPETDEVRELRKKQL
ncbi:unnamed protein product [Cylicostephanus goldi]|uniref:Uncharacterized protein n=1 Tax=Cylicostephanus goldi TaxID=71465 RepID=A0A3P6TDF6_CYLGO|nr:unnamed protein product [Cylicostephanus goldi]